MSLRGEVVDGSLEPIVAMIGPGELAGTLRLRINALDLAGDEVISGDVDVEIVPPENPSSGRGVKFIYAGGAEVIHGGRSGVTFIGTEGEIFVNRGKLESKPDTIIKQEIGADKIHLYKAPGGGHGGHRQDWINCVLSREQPNCPIETGARTVAVCHLGNTVYLHGEKLGGK
jgi:hypothetical protein